MRKGLMDVILEFIKSELLNLLTLDERTCVKSFIVLEEDERLNLKPFAHCFFFKFQRAPPLMCLSLGCKLKVEVATIKSLFVVLSLRNVTYDFLPCLRLEIE
jgi:hypothetical protein